MKMILNALVLVSLSLSCNFAMSAESDDLAAAPTDAVATPPMATPGNDADVKGTIAAPTAEQKANVAKPVKKAQAKKAAKKAHANAKHKAKSKKLKVKRTTSSETASGTTAAAPPAKKVKKKTKKETRARHPHTPNN